MKYLHTMVRVTDLDASLRFCRDALGLQVTRRGDVPDGRMALVRSPDGISVEWLQARQALPPAEPWSSMQNLGAW